MTGGGGGCAAGGAGAGACDGDRLTHAEVVRTEFARQAGNVPYTTTEIRPQVLHGTGPEIRAALDELAERLGVEEFVLDSPVAAFEPRLRSVELLADAVLQGEPTTA